MKITEQVIRDSLKRNSGRVDFSKIALKDSLRKAGMDSMEISHLMLEIEEAGGVTIPDEDLDGLDSDKEILAYLQSKQPPL